MILKAIANEKLVSYFTFTPFTFAIIYSYFELGDFRKLNRTAELNTIIYV